VSKTDGFNMFSNENFSLSTKRTESDVINTMARSGAFGWHNKFIFKDFKAMFLLQFISTLLISVTSYTHSTL